MLFYSPEASLYAAMPLHDMQNYPVKGGSLRHFDPSRPFAKVKKTIRLIPYLGVTLAEFKEKSTDVLFTRYWRVRSGRYPNGIAHYADIYGTEDEKEDAYNGCQVLTVVADPSVSGGYDLVLSGPTLHWSKFGIVGFCPDREEAVAAARGYLIAQIDEVKRRGNAPAAIISPLETALVALSAPDIRVNLASPNDWDL